MGVGRIRTVPFSSDSADSDAYDPLETRLSESQAEVLGLFFGFHLRLRQSSFHWIISIGIISEIGRKWNHSDAAYDSNFGFSLGRKRLRLRIWLRRYWKPTFSLRSKRFRKRENFVPFQAARRNPTETLATQASVCTTISFIILKELLTAFSCQTGSRTDSAFLRVNGLRGNSDSNVNGPSNVTHPQSNVI